ncbi:hypothetical protein [Kitasatospora sp. SC0581]|uniref:hypothetical protein n=1 Tax=Kitasatospora sp. SC0581 TaxID=3394360 RepID=UPI003A850BDE
MPAHAEARRGVRTKSPTATTDRGRRPQRTYATTDLSAIAEEVIPALLYRLLTDDALTRATRELSTEIAAMPSPIAVASHLATLAHRAAARPRTETPPR